MLGVLQGGLLLQGQSASDAIKELSRAFPSPTNAQALAGLCAAFEAPNLRAQAWAVPWLLPLGVMPRMRLAVCGWQGKGRALRSPDDRAWWASKTALPFWPALATYADTVASNAGETSWVLDPKLFAGDSIAISDELVFVAGDLAAMEAEHAADCVPYFMPKRASTQPLPNLPCLAKIKGKQNPGEVEKILPRPLFPRGHIPPWAFWLAIAYLVTKIPE